MNKFLKAKHWQLFLLTFAIPMVFQFIIMGYLVSDMTSQTNQNPILILNSLKLFPIMMIIYISVLFGWYWSVAIGLQKRVPEHVKMKVKKFKLFFLILMTYMLFILMFIGGALNGIVIDEIEPSSGLIGIIGIIIPLHLFSMFCVFYSLYFVAKTLKTVELQREVQFSEFAGEFFMIWFYPIGVWIIQPKINKMIEG